MMRIAMGLVAGLLSLVPLAGQAGEQPVVIELYTSQGCSSCPAADELLSDLARRDDVLPLALHVDYWDYIGWKDIFADPAYTARQKGYAKAAAQRTIYTPQMVIGGVDHVVGNEPMQVMDLVRKHKSRPDAVELDVVRNGSALRITAQPTEDVAGPFVVQLVRYTPSETVEVTRGENAGKRLSYTNIVTAWQILGEWQGDAPLTIDAQANGPAAIVVQKPDHGAIVAAARVR